MSNYLVPRVQIEQEFTQNSTLTTSPLSAFIVGPQYNLYRYSVAAEKASAAVVSSGSSLYTGSEAAYTFQNVEAGAITDLNSLEVILDTVLASYYSTGSQVTLVSGATNQIHSSSLIFKTGNGSTLSAGLYNRAVQVGDTVRLASTSNGSASFSSKVIGLKASITAASTGSVSKTNGAGTLSSHIAISGTYIGAQNITYRVVCTTAGNLAANSGAIDSSTGKFTVYSDNVDSSGPVLAVQGVALALGTQGLSFTISGTSDTTVTLGDEYHVTITASAPGAYNNITLADNIPSSLSGSNFYLVDVCLPISSVTIPEVDALGSLNYTSTSTGITLAAGLTVAISDVNISGVPVDLTVESATVYVTRRDLSITNVGVINNVASTDVVVAAAGVVDVENPLGKALYNALLNSNGVAVYFTAIGSDDLAGYTSAIALANKNKFYYSIVPLTFDSTVQQLIISNVDTNSTANAAKWRIAWLSLDIPETQTLVETRTDNTPFKAVVSANPSGGAYNYVTFQNGGNPDSQAALLDLVVRAGDKFYYNYSLDAGGNTQYSTTTITQVISQTSFVVDYTWSGAVTVPFKAVISRVLTSAEKATNYINTVSGFDNRRVRVAFPNTYKSGNNVEQGYLLAASLAGARSGVAPHQSLTNIQVLGPTDLSVCLTEFTEEDLNNMAGAGTWIVTQTAVGAPAYTRQQLTTAIENINYAEDSITTNVDSISYGLQDALAPYVGIYNINPGTILKISAAIDRELTTRMQNTYTARAGNQLIGYTIDSVAQNPVFKDKINVTITLTVPYPMNNITVTLSI